MSETVVAGKCDAPGQHLVQHAPKGPDVAALVDAVTARLLRAHVGGGAEDRPRRVTRVRSGTLTSSASAAFARPKSSTFTTPSGVILIFAGLRSR